MKRIASFLLALCLLCAAAQASAGISAIFEGAQKEEAHSPAEEPVREAQMVMPMTVQQWIPSFLRAAELQGLALEEDFLYMPVLQTGQHIYNITFPTELDYYLGMSVIGNDGVSIEVCSMRLASSILPSGELTQATDRLWQVVRAMVMASDPQVTTEELDALCKALCPDLPAALLRDEQVLHMVYPLRGISYALAGSMQTEAYWGSSDTPNDGYIVDFVVQTEAAAEPG